MTDGMIDLGAERAARREGKATEIRVKLDPDGQACVLPVEMPVDALAPLKAIDLDRDLGLLFTAGGAAQGEQILRDLLTIRPALGGELLEAGKGCLERLFCSCETPPWDRPARQEHDAAVPEVHDGECQWPRFLSWRPSPQDYVALIRGLWTAYGASLGEAFTPSDSSGDGGATSKPTSKRTTSSTRGASGRTPAKTGS